MTMEENSTSVLSDYLILMLTITIVILSPLLSLNVLLDSGHHDTHRWLQAVLFLIVLLFLIKYLINKSIDFSNFKKLNICLIFFIFLTGFISSVRAKFPVQGFFEWSVFLLIFLTAWLISKEISSVNDLIIEKTLKWITLGSLLYGVKSFFVYFIYLLMGDQPQTTELIIGFDNYRFFNHGQTVTLPLLGLFICTVNNRETNGRIWLIAGWLAFVIWWMLLFLTSGRGTFVGVFTAIAAVAFMRKSLAWPWIKTMLLGALVGFIAYEIFYVALPQIIGLEPVGFFSAVGTRSIENPTSGRWPLWLCAFEMIHAHPWLGAGPLHYAQACASVGIAAHPHNWILQIGSEWGLPVLFLFIFLLIISFQVLKNTAAKLKINDENAQTFATCWLALAVAVTVDGLFSGLLVMPLSQLWITIYIGMAWGWTRSFSPNSFTVISKKLQASALILIFCLLFIFVIGIFESYNFSKNLENYPESKLSLLQPRAWVKGLFGVIEPTTFTSHDRN